MTELYSTMDLTIDRYAVLFDLVGASHPSVLLISHSLEFAFLIIESMLVFHFRSSLTMVPRSFMDF